MSGRNTSMEASKPVAHPAAPDVLNDENSKDPSSVSTFNEIKGKAKADFSPQKASELIGGSSGVSLDGRSLVLMDREFDEVSSINTAQYTFNQDMRILGTVDHDEEHDVEAKPDRAKYRSPNKGSRRRGDSFGGGKYSSTKDKLDDRTVNTAATWYAEGCLPLWITEAPAWLKIMIILSTALLIGAIVLIGVGASLAVQEEQNAVAPFPTGPGFPPQLQPVATPTLPPVDTPTLVPDSGSGGQGDQPTLAPSPKGTFFPTTHSKSTKATFFVTGGRFINNALDALPQQLRSLPRIDGDTVMFHLGDWNSPYATDCKEESYQVNVELFRNSSVPVYFIPGDNEYNDCPDPELAFQYWSDYMLGYEAQFWPEPTWNITRQEPNFPENFAFVHREILVVGINLVGGVVHDTREWQDRHTGNLDWIDEQFLENQGNFEIIMVLAHADPDIQANTNFFEAFYERVASTYTPNKVILVHRNLGVETWGLEPEFNGIENLMNVVVEGSVWPPMLLEIDTKAGTVDVDQSEWYKNYLSSGNGR